MTPGATYRVQLHADFDFDEAAGIADYLAELGVTHLYCSPYLQATPGSSHGYDVVDPHAVSDELGGREGLDRLTEALDRAGLGQVLDIVPNHMAAHPSNPWWWDVLANGSSSRYADFFDIENGGDGLTVLVPILSDHYGRVLDAGGVELRRRGDDLVVAYGDHQLPLSPASTREVLREIGEDVDQGLAAINRDPDRLDQILEMQPYRLARWRVANEELDYRRFFNIETLVGVRVESPEVFSETHALIVDLVHEGVVDGLRVDHVDGLGDPGEYLARLASAGDGVYTVVEKILEPGEHLPADWPVAGTSGYDFLNRVNALYVDGEAEAAFSNLYRAFTGDARDYRGVVREAKWEIMNTQLAVELHRLTALLADICQRHRRHRDHTRRELRTALGEVVASFGVYRTYVRPGQAPTAEDGRRVHEAVAGAIENRPDLDRELLDLIAGIALGQEQGEQESELCRRLQQLTPAVMAKGVEDTGFYRYNRFVSLNEVGGDPGTFGVGPKGFHDETSETAARWPGSLNTLSTHDTKRSADVRARLNVLSELPVEWRGAVEEWAAHNERHRESPWPDRNTEYLLYQTLVGAWPIDADRASAYLAKATKEAKTHTSWVDPDPEYETAIERFVRATLADGDFIALLERFIEEGRVVERGRRNSLSQLALALTAPGVPDIYQGTEVWEHSLVDPDNRRPVDYDERRNLLRLVGDADLSRARHSPGGLKLWLAHRLLHHRREHPEAYRPDAYQPLGVTGDGSHGLVAFARHRLVVVARTRTAPKPPPATVELPSGRWSDLLTGTGHRGGATGEAVLLGDLPVAVLITDPR